MKTIRPANPLPTGPDVERVQKALAAAGFLPESEIDGVYGPHTISAVLAAKRALKYPTADLKPIAGDRLLKALESHHPPHPPKDANEKLRELIVDAARWGVRHEPSIHYQQSRPIDGLHDPFKLPLYTDCSGFATDCYAWAGAPDPNGLGYNGEGYTGTLLHHGRLITPAMAKPADMVVFGSFPGHHVVVIVEAGADPLTVSHGQERGPIEIRLSQERLFQPAPAQFLAFLDEAA